MLSREEDIDAHALHSRGWTISAIARHLGRDRKTIRAYLNGERQPGQRKLPEGSDWFEPFALYCRARLAEDPHLWASTLFDEVTDLGFDRSYQTLTRQLRARGLRPACEPCRPAKGRPVAVIEHPPGDETQWDWLELPDPPAHWGWGKKAYLLVGALAHSSFWRAWLAGSMDQPHLIEGLDAITRSLGGVTIGWRFDRMATVISPETGRVQASFAAVAKYYGVEVRACPPRRGNRKGVVEKANHSAAQRFWRNMPDFLTPEQAQARLDDWCLRRADARARKGQEGTTSVAALAAAEPLRPPPATPFPAQLTVIRKVSAQALVSYRGNRYSVPPELALSEVSLGIRLGSGYLEISTGPSSSSSQGLAMPVIIARHRLATDGAGVAVRDHGHVIALEQAALAASTPAAPHRSKQRIPPGPAARAAAANLRGEPDHSTTPAPTDGQPAGQPTGRPTGEVVIDLARYVSAARGRNTLHSTTN